MKLTWYGHSAFRVDAGDARILIDPFLTGNPSWQGGWKGPSDGITHLLLTHGHNDHVGDAVEILKATGAMLVANFEICMFLVGQGVSGERINPGNTGGTVDCGGCDDDQQCGANAPFQCGTANLPGSPSCRPLSAAQACADKECGVAFDGCGTTLAHSFDCAEVRGRTGCPSGEFCGIRAPFQCDEPTAPRCEPSAA